MLEGLEDRIQELRMCQRKVKSADECNSLFTAHIIVDSLIGVFHYHLVLANEQMRLLVQVIGELEEQKQAPRCLEYIAGVLRVCQVASECTSRHN